MIPITIRIHADRVDIEAGKLTGDAPDQDRAAGNQK